MKKIALVLSIVLLLGAIGAGAAACNKGEYKITVDGAANGKVDVFKGTEEVSNGNIVAKGSELTVKAVPHANYMLDTLKVAGKEVTHTEEGYKFTVEKHTEIKATFKHAEVPVKTLASMSLTVKDAGMGNYVYAAGKVMENCLFKYDIPRAATDKKFTRLFSIEKVGTAGDVTASKVHLMLNDASADYQGDIWDVLNNMAFAKVTGNVLSGVTVPAKYVGYWGNATIGNNLTASAATDTAKAENFNAMFIADVAGTYKITVTVVDVTSKTSVDFNMPLATHSVTLTVK